MIASEPPWRRNSARARRLSLRSGSSWARREPIQKSQRSPTITRESSRRQSAQPGAEAAIAIGSVISQVNIAGEVVRHGRNILAVCYSWSESPNKRPVRRRDGRAVGQVLSWLARFSPPEPASVPARGRLARGPTQRLGKAGLCRAA